LQQQKSSKFTNSSRFSKNQAGLKIIGALQKSGGFEKYWHLTEK
jgi:hypothetical protein